jgi:hypothetical protein
MPLNYKLLEKAGTHEKRLRQLFEASMEKLPPDATEKQKEEMAEDVKMRQRIEEIISSRINSAILCNLKAAHLHGAVDLAWDSSTITRRNIPLVMYAQRRIDVSKCLNELEQLKCKDQFVKYDAQKRPVGIDLPKFTEVSVNLVRSIITRRTAAQSARFTNLYPFFKYEARGTSEADKLRADVLSQRIDIMADQYGYRTTQIEAIRDMLLYPHVIGFPACKWDREVEWYDENESKAVEFKGEDAKPKSRVRREGVPLTIPHPSRTFYDLAHPVTTINTDTGCEWFGFWDLTRYSTILDSADFFNRTEVGFHPESAGHFFNYSSYFAQYYTAMTPPMSQEKLSAVNDRVEQAGRYDATCRDTPLFLTHLYWKIKPNQWRMGDYPFQVWLHLVVANSNTVVAAEIMPDTPGFVLAYNNSHQRLHNLSMAHEIMPFQDQLTNLYSQLLECVKRDLFGIALLNIDCFPADNPEVKELLDQFRSAMKSENFYAAMSVLEVSLIKMTDLGVNLDSVFKIYRQPPNTQLTEIITAISQTIMLAERVMALSPQEQAQLSPRETSATEVQIIAGTTENIYQFISDAIDDGRAALKRYVYNALMSLGTEEIRLPVVNRYRKEVAEKIGFNVTDEESTEGLMQAGTAKQFSVIGTVRSLICEYIFSSRDGAERASNIQSAQVLTQLMAVLMQPHVLAMLTKEKFADLINAIIRQSGAGVDLIIEPPPGTGAEPVMPPQPPALPASVGPELAAAELPKQ